MENRWLKVESCESWKVEDGEVPISNDVTGANHVRPVYNQNIEKYCE